MSNIAGSTSPLSKEDIEAVLTRKLKNKKFEVISCTKHNPIYLPIGFLSSQEKVCIKYITEGCKEELHLFIKRVPSSQYLRDVVVSGGGFRKEVILFETFLNDLKAKLKGNPIPTCYLSRPDDIVILNDLSHEGFSNFPLLEPLPEEHVRKTLESIAVLHGASIIFEKKHDCKMDDFIPVLKEETIFSSDDNNLIKKAVTAGISTIKNTVTKTFPQYDKELTKKVFCFVDQLVKKIKPSTKYQNVISHCDLWGNNIMFNYDDAGKVTEACIIDFQIASYRSPAYDLLQFLHTCTAKKLRDEKYTDLIKHYYIHLEKIVKSEGIDLNDILSWSDLEATIEENRPILLVVAALCLNFVLMPDNIIREILHDNERYKQYYENDRTDFTLRAIEDCPPYRKRLLEALSEMLDYFK